MAVEICFVLLRADAGYDGLLADYRAAGETIVLGPGDDAAPTVQALVARGFRHAIVNSSASAPILPALIAAGLAPLLLVHELPQMFAALGVAETVATSGAALRGIIAPTETIAAMLVGHGVPAAQISVRPQGQYRLLAPISRMRAAGAMQVVIGIGRADRRKGIDLFVATCAAMERQAQPMRFVWQGDWDPGTRAQLSGEVDRLVAAGWLTLKPDSADVAATLSSGDMFFLASREDPLPSAAIEAWSSGLPVVTFRGTGGIADMIACDPALGVLASRTDPRAAVAALRQAIDPPGDRERRGRVRAAIAADRFDWGRYCRHLVGAAYAAPTVDVAIVGHDHGRFARTRIDSLLHQSLPPTRIGYHDVASVDGSATIAAQLASASAGRIAFTALPDNHGRLDRTWRDLAAASTAEFFHIAEGDDSIARTMLDRCVAGLQAAPDAAFAFCGVDWIDADGRTIARHAVYPVSVIGEGIRPGGEISAATLLDSDFLVKNPVLSMSSVVWRRSHLLALLDGSADAFGRMRFAYDWLLYILAARAGHSAVFVPEALCQHRQHTGSFAARSEIARHAAEIARLYEAVPTRDAVQRDGRRAYLSSLGG